jgi:phosphosulfolactate synthase (CoM biosynthesis protein A)
MDQNLIARVQGLMTKVDNLKVSKIETETKIKSLEESLKENLEKAKELGYNSVEELVQAQTQLEESVKQECDLVEKALKEAGV